MLKERKHQHWLSVEITALNSGAVLIQLEDKTCVRVCEGSNESLSSKVRPEHGSWWEYWSQHNSVEPFRGSDVCLTPKHPREPLNQSFTSSGIYDGKELTSHRVAEYSVIPQTVIFDRRKSKSILFFFPSNTISRTFSDRWISDLVLSEQIRLSSAIGLKGLEAQTKEDLRCLERSLYSTQRDNFIRLKLF